MRKVSVIGGGNVGATAALYIAERGVADVTLVDILEGVPQGKSLDLLQSRSVRGFDSKITGTNDFKDIAGSDVVLQTAGFPRKPGMSRTDLLKANAEIIEKAAAAIREFAPKAVVICVTNPLDAMTWLMYKKTGFPPERVMGMAGVLDSARFCCFIAEELGVSANDVQAMVLGGHGDSMVPLPRYTTVSGISLPDLMSKEKIDALVKRTASAAPRSCRCSRPAAPTTPPPPVPRRWSTLSPTTDAMWPSAFWPGRSHWLSPCSRVSASTCLPAGSS